MKGGQKVAGLIFLIQTFTASGSRRRRACC